MSANSKQNRNALIETLTLLRDKRNSLNELSLLVLSQRSVSLFLAASAFQDFKLDPNKSEANMAGEGDYVREHSAIKMAQLAC